eukprot:CAMPEP_0118925398 /NCGR_PEP_ID=MMETSP1169-20130426/3283_1 /TAXON_ID=36882 /ORGANISM="Pyramimonas obovata, Strain CCMP722" /LENGTH=155 /DNA_ID=CAMNT_0006866687 /DNA_START=139 /DNA_END=607 /DNA_ORIENTATION=-
MGLGGLTINIVRPNVQGADDIVKLPRANLFQGADAFHNNAGANDRSQLAWRPADFPCTSRPDECADETIRRWANPFRATSPVVETPPCAEYCRVPSFDEVDPRLFRNGYALGNDRGDLSAATTSPDETAEDAAAVPQSVMRLALNIADQAIDRRI